MNVDREIDELLHGVASKEMAGTYPSISHFGRGQAFDASSVSSNEIGLWAPPIQTIDNDIIPEKSLADARVRDVVRNDAFTRGAVNTFRDSIVGECFLLNSTPNTQVLGLDDVWASEFQEEVESKFTLYAESLMHWVDAGATNTLTELVRLAVGVYVMSGEVLASVEWKDFSSRPFKTAIQLIESERLCNPDGRMDTQTLRAGVQRDAYGAPLGYWIRNSMPTDWMQFPNIDQWQYVPAFKPWGRPQMIHIVDQWGPNQTRGISNIVAALKELKMLKRYKDIVLQSAALNAVYAASIESDLPTNVVMDQLGATKGDPALDWSKSYLSAIAKYTAGSKNLTYNNSKIPVFYPGTKLNLQVPQTPGVFGTQFEASSIRYFCAATGISFEQISKDYSQANYSNLKAALAETDKRIRVEKKRVADRLASLVFRLWLEEAMNANEIQSLPRNYPNWYKGMNAEAYSQCTWIGANQGQIDGLKETQAAVLRIRNGLGTHEDELASLGKDWRRVFRQLKREQDTIEKLGLNLNFTDTNNMMNATTAQPADEGTDSGAKPGGTK